MVVWINGPYGVGKSTLARALCAMEPGGFLFDAEAVGNAVRDNLPKSRFNGYIFENYPMWFHVCAELLADIAADVSGNIYVPMTLVYADSFEKLRTPLEQAGIRSRHILLTSTHRVVRERILGRGEEEDCWCMRHIDLCLDNQRAFDEVIRIDSTEKSPEALAELVLDALKSEA